MSSSWQIPNRWAAAGIINFSAAPAIVRGTNLSGVARDADGDFRVICTQKLPPDNGDIRGAVAFLRPTNIVTVAGNVPTQVITNINADGDVRCRFLNAAGAGVNPGVAYSLLALLTPAGTGQ